MSGAGAPSRRKPPAAASKAWPAIVLDGRNMMIVVIAAMRP
jgi:hypothetical protein